MSDALNIAEIGSQHVELLPSRTVLGIMGILTAIFGGTDACDTTWGPPSATDASGTADAHGNTGESTSSVKEGPGKGVDGFGHGGGDGTGGDGGYAEQRVITDKDGAVSHHTQDVSGGDGFGGSVR